MDAASPNPFSIKLWPPSQNTRHMLVERMKNNLTSKSIFTQSYGVLTQEEAEENAKQIEGVAFSTANEPYEKDPDGDGSSAVLVYARACSKLFLEALKRGPRSKEDRELLLSEKTMDDREELTSKKVTTAEDTFFDISKGQRAFIGAEEAEEILRPLKELGNSYTKICFSNRSFGLAAARVAERILASVKSQLKEVDLSDVVAGRPEAIALEVMKIFSEALEGSVLKSLNLSDNALAQLNKKGEKRFFFEDKWKRFDECLNIVTTCWFNGSSGDNSGVDNMTQFLDKLRKSQELLVKWSAMEFKGNKKEKIKRLIREVKKWKEKGDQYENGENLRKAELQIENHLQEEETYWRQRSRADWLKDGDKNTTFFHSKASERRRVNEIKGILNEESVWVQDEHEIEEVACSYFENLF